MRGWGWTFVLLGLALGLWGLFFPTYLTFDDGTIGDVNNIGLINDRLVVVLAAGFSFLSGIILVAAGSIAARLPPPDPPAD